MNVNLEEKGGKRNNFMYLFIYFVLGWVWLFLSLCMVAGSIGDRGKMLSGEMTRNLKVKKKRMQKHLSCFFFCSATQTIKVWCNYWLIKTVGRCTHRRHTLTHKHTQSHTHTAHIVLYLNDLSSGKRLFHWGNLEDDITGAGNMNIVVFLPCITCFNRMIILMEGHSAFHVYCSAFVNENGCLHRWTRWMRDWDRRKTREREKKQKTDALFIWISLVF